MSTYFDLSICRRSTYPNKDDAKIVRFVEKNRGIQKTTVKTIKAAYPFLKRLSNTLVRERLHEAELKWLRRRRKSLVDEPYLKPRVDFAKWVLGRHDSTLKRWAYSDGTCYYLDRSESESEQKRRRALGIYVWRRSTNADALCADCVGPSSYAKGQGEPLKVWGLVANGILHITILPKGEHMNRWWYAWIVEHYFPKWLDGCDLLVQDHEGCLRKEEPLEAMKTIGVSLVPNYPKSCQDLNTCENAWKYVQDRLFETMPAGRESRDEFIPRLRNAVDWVNRNQHDALLELCHNQKKRARELLDGDPPGARTRW